MIVNEGNTTLGNPGSECSGNDWGKSKNGEGVPVEKEPPQKKLPKKAHFFISKVGKEG